MKGTFKYFLNVLPEYLGTTTSNGKLDSFLDRVRNSSLSAAQIAQLRDSIPIEATSSEAWQKRNVVKGQLQYIYDERVRKDKAWYNRPWARILIPIAGTIIAGLAVYYLTN